jgi:hypothetical protein
VKKGIGDPYSCGSKPYTCFNHQHAATLAVKREMEEAEQPEWRNMKNKEEKEKTTRRKQ